MKIYTKLFLLLLFLPVADTTCAMKKRGARQNIKKKNVQKKSTQRRLKQELEKELKRQLVEVELELSLHHKNPVKREILHYERCLLEQQVGSFRLMRKKDVVNPKILFDDMIMVHAKRAKKNLFKRAEKELSEEDQRTFIDRYNREVAILRQIERVCHKCSRTAQTLLCCPNCKSIFYCSSRCQKADLTDHREKCARLKALSKAGVHIMKNGEQKVGRKMLCPNERLFVQALTGCLKELDEKIDQFMEETFSPKKRITPQQRLFLDILRSEEKLLLFEIKIFEGNPKILKELIPGIEYGNDPIKYIKLGRKALLKKVKKLPQKKHTPFLVRDGILETIRKRVVASCSGCGKESFRFALKRCSRCRTTYYCSVECQRANWLEHKKVCTPSK